MEEQPPVSEEMKVLGWRLLVLLNAGYAEELACELAGASGVDLHRAVELVEQGCAPPTAARILL